MVAAVAQTGAGNLTTGATTAGLNVVVAKPANTVVGDLLVASVRYHNNSQTITPPAGWTSVFSFNTNWTHHVFVKPITAAEAATDYTFTVPSGSARWAGVIFRVTGANLTSPAAVVGTYSAATGTASVVVPGITTTAPGLLLAFTTVNVGGTGSGGAAFGAPAGMTAVGSGVVDNGANMTSLYVAQQSLTAATTTGTRTVTHTPSGTNSGGVLIEIANESNPEPPTIGPATVDTLEPGESVVLTTTASSPTWAVTAGSATLAPAGSTCTVTPAPNTGTVVSSVTVRVTDGATSLSATRDIPSHPVTTFVLTAGGLKPVISLLNS